jgi:glycosyltransferase involved in cell wall biosynthesis
MSQWSGIGRYIRGLTFGLCQRNQFHYLFFESHTIKPYGWKEQFAIPLKMYRSDCLHTPNFNAPYFWPKKLIVTFHDLILFHHPNHLSSLTKRTYAQVMLPLIARRADAIIAVSEFTKQDLVKSFRIDPKKITVVYHGVNRELLMADADHEVVQNAEPYFLYVGLIKAHKNVGVLLDAFQKLKRKYPDRNVALRLVGSLDRKQSVVRAWAQTIETDPNIHLHENVNDEQLKALYEQAIALAFPSLFEGFGFPVLEAMALGTPVLAARSSSIPEILGDDAGLYFDPHSSMELLNQMGNVLDNQNLRSELSNKGRLRSQSFTWQRSAQMTEQVYESVL